MKDRFVLPTFRSECSDLLQGEDLQDTYTSECMHDEFRCMHMSSRRHVRMHVKIYTLRGQSFERALVLIFTTEVGLGQKLALHILW